jgi:heptosyltransferase-2/heptosyltransferase-3
VFGACGGAALYRRAMLDDVGLFDEAYFAYLEDVDLAWRARLRGWDARFAPGALVRHAHAGTLGEGSPLKRFLLARNKVWTVVKCAPDPHSWTRFPMTAVYDAGAATFGVARQRDWASVRGRLAAVAALPEVLRKRQEIQSRRTVSAESLADVYAPLAAPWDVPRRYQHLLPPDRRPPRQQHLTSPKAATLPHQIRRVGLHAAGRVLRGSSPDRFPAPPQRIVVLRPDHLGDVLLSRPALSLVRGALPSAEIVAVVGPWGAPALQGLEITTSTYEFPGFSRAPKASAVAPYLALRAFAKELQAGRYDAALVLRPDHWWGALAVAWAGIPVRVGHATPDTTLFLTETVARDDTRHAALAAAQAAAKLLEAIGAPTPERVNEMPIVSFSPSAAGLEAVKTWLLANHVEPGFIVLHPGAGALLKTWPVHRWAAVCRSLPSDTALVLTGGPGEEPDLREICRLLDREAHLALGLDWDALAALYQGARLVIGMDSGPLHLAAAVGTPTVRVYGPTDIAIYGPNGDPATQRAIQGNLPCAPCRDLIAPPCGHLSDPPCLAAVSVDDVSATIADVLHTTQLRTPAAP